MQRITKLQTLCFDCPEYNCPKAIYTQSSKDIDYACIDSEHRITLYFMTKVLSLSDKHYLFGPIKLHQNILFLFCFIYIG